MIVQDYKGYPGSIIIDAKLFERNHEGLYILFYLLPDSILNNYGETYFGNWKKR
jgi:hypothetical protein